MEREGRIRGGMECELPTGCIFISGGLEISSIRKVKTKAYSLPLFEGMPWGKFRRRRMPQTKTCLLFTVPVGWHG